MWFKTEESKAEKLLKSGNATIEQLLKESSVVDLKINEDFARFLLKNPNNIKKLIHFALREPFEQQQMTDKKELISYSFNAKQLLSVSESGDQGIKFLPEFLLQQSTEEILDFLKEEGKPTTEVSQSDIPMYSSNFDQREAKEEQDSKVISQEQQDNKQLPSKDDAGNQNTKAVASALSSKQIQQTLQNSLQCPDSNFDSQRSIRNSREFQINKMQEEGKQIFNYLVNFVYEKRSVDCEDASMDYFAQIFRQFLKHQHAVWLVLMENNASLANALIQNLQNSGTANLMVELCKQPYIEMATVEEQNSGQKKEKEQQEKQNGIEIKQNQVKISKLDFLQRIIDLFCNLNNPIHGKHQLPYFTDNIEYQTSVILQQYSPKNSQVSMHEEELMNTMDQIEDHIEKDEQMQKAKPVSMEDRASYFMLEDQLENAAHIIIEIVNEQLDSDIILTAEKPKKLATLQFLREQVVSAVNIENLFEIAQMTQNKNIQNIALKILKYISGCSLVSSSVELKVLFQTFIPDFCFFLQNNNFPKMRVFNKARGATQSMNDRDLEGNVPSQHKVNTQFGDRINVFGEARFTVLEIIANFVSFNAVKREERSPGSRAESVKPEPIDDEQNNKNQSILIETLKQTDLLRIMINLVFKFEWNNIMHIQVYKIIQRIVQLNNKQIISFLLGGKIDLVDIIFNNYRKDNIFIKVGINQKEIIRGYVSFLENLAIYLNEQTYMMTIENNQVTYDGDENSGIDILQTPDFPFQKTNEQIRGKNAGIQEKIEKEIEIDGEKQTISFYKLANQKGWIKLKKQNTIFSQMKESEMNENYEFWISKLFQNPQWELFRQNKLLPLKKMEENIGHQVETQIISKIQILERSKSTMGSKQFWSEPATLDIYDKREVFLEIVTQGCNLYICHNKYCANNAEVKKKLTYLEAAILFKELPKSELDSLYDCKTFAQLQRIESQISHSNIKEDEKELIVKQLESLEEEFIEVTSYPGLNNLIQKYEDLQRKAGELIKKCSEKIQFCEIKINAKKIQQKISEKYLEVIDKQHKNFDRNRDIDLCLKIGRIYQTDVGDFQKARKFYGRALHRSVDMNSKLQFYKSKHSLNRLQEARVIQQIKETEDSFQLRFKRLYNVQTGFNIHQHNSSQNIIQSQFYSDRRKKKSSLHELTSANSLAMQNQSNFKNNGSSTRPPSIREFSNDFNELNSNQKNTLNTNKLISNYNGQTAKNANFFNNSNNNNNSIFPTLQSNTNSILINNH